MALFAFHMAVRSRHMTCPPMTCPAFVRLASASSHWRSMEFSLIIYTLLTVILGLLVLVESVQAQGAGAQP